MEQAFEESVQEFRREDGMGEYCPEETAAILDLMGRMLTVRPEERATIEQVLDS
ncbi:hypothetical protein E4U41_007678 [Claviceps citrina]|nr:hypothetical protein E4U41_007678 [Claviceps citrina]